MEKIDYLSTLAGYIHWKLTGQRVVGIGEASGMFPIDSATGDYDAEMMQKFDALVADKGFPWKLREILPKVLRAGEMAGTLTKEGARLLDRSGCLQPGVPLCPPEGDAGTGMTATKSVEKRTGNVSAGTSVFAMIVLEKPLSAMHREIDMVTTPAGDPVAMVHCNNCTSDLNAWVGLFAEFAECFGIKADKNKLFSTLYQKAMEGDKDCGGMIACNYYSGEPVTGLEEGRPMFLRRPDSHLGLANFMRSHLYASLVTLKIGLDILLKEEDVKIDSITGHGGLFKTKGVGQSILAAAMNAPISVMETAGEGGESLLSGAYDSATLENLSRQGTSARFIQLCTLLQEAAAQLQFSVNRRTDAELCILKLCDETLSGDLAALNARIARLEEQIAAGVQFAARNAASAPAPAQAPAKAAVKQEAPKAAPKTAEEALPWDEPPLPDDYDAPPPYGEPVERAEKSVPAEKSAPKQAEPAAPLSEGSAADDDTFYQLMESYKNRLTPDKRAFIGTAEGEVKDGLLTVYCTTEVQKAMLDQQVVIDVLSDVTSRAVGQEIRVRFLVGPRPGAKKRDRMQDLLRMGSKFDNFTVK